MNREGLMDTRDVKKAIRDEAHARRRAQENKDALSEIICGKFTALDEFARARCVMAYIDVRAEVRTRQHLPRLLEGDKPYLNNPNDLLDPWGNPYVVLIPGEVNYDFDIVSYGADGQPGGEGEDSDIYSGS